MSDVSDLDPPDGLEVVPLESDDAEMWDANNENEDDFKSSHVKSTVFLNLDHCGYATNSYSTRVRPPHSRGGVPRPGSCEPKKNENGSHQ
jgi:hypothetical protein